MLDSRCLPPSFDEMTWNLQGASRNWTVKASSQNFGWVVGHNCICVFWKRGCHNYLGWCSVKKQNVLFSQCGRQLKNSSIFNSAAANGSCSFCVALFFSLFILTALCVSFVIVKLRQFWMGAVNGLQWLSFPCLLGMAKSIGASLLFSEVFLQIGNTK